MLKLLLNELLIMHKIDFSVASSEAVAADLCKRLDDIRLSRNITQASLAHEAGVSRSTITRIADGKGVSLDSFIRVMQALNLADHLLALLPDPDVRPVERVKFKGTERKRASKEKHKENTWSWGDEGNNT